MIRDIPRNHPIHNHLPLLSRNLGHFAEVVIMMIVIILYIFKLFSLQAAHGNDIICMTIGGTEDAGLVSLDRIENERACKLLLVKHRYNKYAKYKPPTRTKVANLP